MVGDIAIRLGSVSIGHFRQRTNDLHRAVTVTRVSQIDKSLQAWSRDGYQLGTTFGDGIKCIVLLDHNGNTVKHIMRSKRSVKVLE